MITWPAHIPFFKLRQGYSAQPGENTIRTQMDVGPAKWRRRTTSAPSVITAMAYMTRAEAQRFEMFWRDTLKDGMLSFTKTDGQWRRRNLLVQSENVNSAAWSLSDFTLGSANSVFTGLTAVSLQNSGVGTSKAILQTAGVFGGSLETMTAVVEKTTALQTSMGIRDLTAPNWVAYATLNWATMSLSGIIGSAAMKSLGTGPNGGAMAQISVTGSGFSGQSRGVLVYPTGTSSNTLTSVLHWVQLEEASKFTEYEPVGATYASQHVTRGGLKAYRIVGVPAFDLIGQGHGVPVTLEILP